MFTITASRTAGGTQCDFGDGEVVMCAPGDGQCAVGTSPVDCVGRWTECTAFCEATFVVDVPRSAGGAVCEADAGNTRKCAGGEGSCRVSVDCVGAWFPQICQANCYDQTYLITRYPSGADASNCPVPDLAVQACLPGMGLCRTDSPVDCVGHWEPATCQADCQDRYYVIDVPRQAGGAPCAIIEGTEDQCLPGMGACPASAVPQDCEGEWVPAVCQPDCADRMFTVTSPAQAGGTECFFRHGASMPCVEGMGTCSANGKRPRDCEGFWEPPICQQDCGLRTWTTTREPSGGGALCEHQTGYQALCQKGEGLCEIDRDCEGNWSNMTCPEWCRRTGAPNPVYIVTALQSGGGAHCPWEAGQLMLCGCSAEEIAAIEVALADATDDNVGGNGLSAQSAVPHAARSAVAECCVPCAAWCHLS